MKKITKTEDVFIQQVVTTKTGTKEVTLYEDCFGNVYHTQRDCEKAETRLLIQDKYRKLQIVNVPELNIFYKCGGENAKLVYLKSIVDIETLRGYYDQCYFNSYVDATQVPSWGVVIITEDANYKNDVDLYIAQHLADDVNLVQTLLDRLSPPLVTET